jgi:hypothetical protein
MDKHQTSFFKKRFKEVEMQRLKNQCAENRQQEVERRVDAIISEKYDEIIQ